MGAIDARLWQYGRTTRRYVVVVAVLGVAGAVTLIVQAGLLASVISRTVTGSHPRSAIVTLTALLAVVFALRACLPWITAVCAHRASDSVKRDLRRHVASRLAALGPRGLRSAPTGDVTVLATSGIDALDGYYGKYLPQLMLACVVPVSVIAVIARVDWLSAVLLVVMLPIIPVFMVLIGTATRERTTQRLKALQTLSGHFLDVVSGVTTLKLFGRSSAQMETIAEVTDEYRRTTVAGLRLAFLSSLVLEVVASLSVAVVAVSVGLRLLGGHIGIGSAFFVLMLSPEVYLPLRTLGANFHASADGLRASSEVFQLLDTVTPRVQMGVRAANPYDVAIDIDELVVHYPGRAEPAVARLSLRIEPGDVIALTGPSGCGKSTVLGALSGLIEPTGGCIRVGGVDLRSVDPASWQRHLAWVPQRPHLFAASIADNVRIGRSAASVDDVRHALEDAGLAEVVDRLPLGMETGLGQGGFGLSAGERQRLAVARALVRGASLLLLDEPTAALDGETELEFLDVLRRVARGRTVVIAAHRRSLLSLADRVVSLEPVDAHG